MKASAHHFIDFTIGRDWRTFSVTHNDLNIIAIIGIVLLILRKMQLWWLISP